MKALVPVVTGALGAGALGLALIGPGSFASDTSAVTANQKIVSGSFQLEAKAGAPTVAGTLVYDANSIGQPKMSSLSGAEPAVPDGNAVAFTLGNIAPGDTYTEPVTIYDVGSLQGQVDTVSYMPGATSALESAMTVTVQVYATGSWKDVHVTQGTGATGVPVSAAYAHTFYLTYKFGPQFLQPNPTMTTHTNGIVGSDELSATFRVAFSFTDTTATQNALEHLSAAPSLTFNGTSTP